MNRHRNLILKEEPNYIWWIILITIIIISFLLLATFYKYNKFTKFSGLVQIEGSDNFVQILVPYDNLGIIKNDYLIVNGIEQNFIYEITNNIYSENNKIYILIKLKFNNNYELGQIVDITFKSEKTTFVNEIKNKIKKGMM